MIKMDIRLNAVSIRALIAERGALNFNEIAEITGYDEFIILLSLGWLAKENKVAFMDKDGVIYVKLAHAYSEKYY